MSARKSDSSLFMEVLNCCFGGAVPYCTVLLLTGVEVFNVAFFLSTYIIVILCIRICKP